MGIVSRWQGLACGCSLACCEWNFCESQTHGLHSHTTQLMAGFTLWKCDECVVFTFNTSI